LNASGEPLSESTTQLYDLAGPLCFAGDYLARSVQLPVLHEGDWLVIHETGANAYGLWSRHCSRDIPAVLAHSSNRGTLEKLSDRVAIAY
jgi:diaminopimelate decarboxylase